MMKLNKKPCRGTRDFFPSQQRGRLHLFDRMREVAESFGYEPYDGPLIEEVDLYRAKSGDELIDEQIYSFEDRGGRQIAIRPEMTPTLARMVAQIHREHTKPLRWYSIPNLMRYEKPQRGRLREHWQFNVDIFGAPELSGELEVLQLIRNFLESFGANDKHFQILINDRTLVDHVFKDLMKSSPKACPQIYKVVDKSKKMPTEKLALLIENIGLSSPALAIFHDYLKISSLEMLDKFLNLHNSSEYANNLHTLFDYSDTIGLKPYLTYDPTIVRGLDYYTGIVFEVFDKNPENPRAISGGGSYQNLLDIFKEPSLAGTGFGMGDVTLANFLEGHNLLPDLALPSHDILVTYQENSAKKLALTLSNQLRKHGLTVVFQLEPVKIKKALAIGEKRGAKNVSFIGTEEISTKTVQFRNMKSKQQKTFSFENIEAMIGYINES